MAQVGDHRRKVWNGRYWGNMGAEWTLSAITVEFTAAVPRVTEHWNCTTAATLATRSSGGPTGGGGGGASAPGDGDGGGGASTGGGGASAPGDGDGGGGASAPGDGGGASAPGDGGGASAPDSSGGGSASAPGDGSGASAPGDGDGGPAGHGGSANLKFRKLNNTPSAHDLEPDMGPPPPKLRKLNSDAAGQGGGASSAGESGDGMGPPIPKQRPTLRKVDSGILSQMYPDAAEDWPSEDRKHLEPSPSPYMHTYMRTYAHTYRPTYQSYQ